MTKIIKNVLVFNILFRIIQDMAAPLKNFMSHRLKNTALEQWFSTAGTRPGTWRPFHWDFKYYRSQKCIIKFILTQYFSYRKAWKISLPEQLTTKQVYTGAKGFKKHLTRSWTRKGWEPLNFPRGIIFFFNIRKGQTNMRTSVLLCSHRYWRSNLCSIGMFPWPE